MTPTKASHHSSPLRYPGGKAKLATYVKAVLRANSLLDRTYIEPYAGGAGVALSLLLHGYVRRIVLNDISVPIHAFWSAVLDESDRFREKILSVELSVEEWRRQREIFRNPDGVNTFELGFAAFYLNRTNRSGVLNGGIIGGFAQNSAYGIDARFNRAELAFRVARIAKVRSQISILRKDAADLLTNLSDIAAPEECFVYADPPYFKKGRDLYYDFYRPEDHELIRDSVFSLRNTPWIVSYDNEPEIIQLFGGRRSIEYDLSYSVRNGRTGREVMFFSDDLVVPNPEDYGILVPPSGAHEAAA